ncbi:HCL556Wp [Eremothecium sinecaudum]|uniref:HCL556Wp n=1 Tax=Eremothecium sinecaudum TaxID=45286 RepID=A0A109UY14_9SACH|nr:HCL556Wp [Eremothecium sinecaudum]AMD19595.1 HCL556Wp [Eremothecium sinecaudum]
MRILNVALSLAAVAAVHANENQALEGENADTVIYDTIVTQTVIQEAPVVENHAQLNLVATKFVTVTVPAVAPAPAPVETNAVETNVIENSQVQDNQRKESHATGVKNDGYWAVPPSLTLVQTNEAGQPYTEFFWWIPPHLQTHLATPQPSPTNQHSQLSKTPESTMSHESDRQKVTHSAETTRSTDDRDKSNSARKTSSITTSSDESVSRSRHAKTITRESTTETISDDDLKSFVTSSSRLLTFAANIASEAINNANNNHPGVMLSPIAGLVAAVLLAL